MVALDSQKIENYSRASRNPEDHDDQIDEINFEDTGAVIQRFKFRVNSEINVNLRFCLDVMIYLSTKLDRKSLLEKISFIWTKWTSTNDILFTCTGEFVFRFMLWCLRYASSLIMLV